MLRLYRPTLPIRWDWLALRGPDAADFLHRLTTINVRAMRAGEESPGFFLTAQGKIRAYFHLWKISGEEFFLELDAGKTGQWKQELLDTIEQFHFSEKFTVGKAPAEAAAGAGTGADLACIWVFGEEAGQLTAPSGGTPGVRVFNHGSVDFGVTWLSVWAERGALDAWVGGLQGSQTIGFEDIERMRITAARPWIDSELSHETIPLEAGLVEALSENKGCYPGQEVIEKIISLGSPARRLVKLEGSGPAPAAGEAIFVAEGAEEGAAGNVKQEIGRVTSAVSAVASNGVAGFQALGFVRKTHAKPGVEVRFSAQAASRARIALVTGYKSGPERNRKAEP